MTKSVYYLTGMGGRLETGLGQALLSKGLDVIGRELTGEFRQLRFQEQVDAVASELHGGFWNTEARVNLPPISSVEQLVVRPVVLREE